jgi:hypothetical protein
MADLKVQDSRMSERLRHLLKLLGLHRTASGIWSWRRDAGKSLVKPSIRRPRWPQSVRRPALMGFSSFSQGEVGVRPSPHTRNKGDRAGAAATLV